MTILVSSTGRFIMTADGALWAPPSLEYRLWRYYLDVFDRVKLFARATRQEQPPAGWKKASGEGVEAVPLPYGVGPAGFLGTVIPLRRAIRRAVAHAEAIMLRVPCHIGEMVCRSLPKGRPYGVEVLGDPYDVLAPGAVKHFGRPFFRWWYPRQLRYECAHASTSAYVTAQTLQRRYPPTPGSFSTHFSSTGLVDADFVVQPRTVRSNSLEFNLVTVGTLEWLYKGTDVLIEAVALCVQNGLNLKLTIVGEGKFRRQLASMVETLGLGERVEFLGELPSGDVVRAQLDRADLFVLPSRAEGLPRAMIEAMARALPCIGSMAGGIPELLSSEDMAPPGNARALASKIRAVLSDPGRMQSMSARNLAIAQNYRRELQGERRKLFYQHLKTSTQQWLDSRAATSMQSITAN